MTVTCSLSSSLSSYLESDNDRCGKVEFSGSSNDSLSNNITPHDASEDVDKDCVDLQR